MLKDAIEAVGTMIVIMLGLGIMLAIVTAAGAFVSWILSPTDYTGKEKKEKDGSYTEERAPDKNERKMPEDGSGRE